MSSINFDNAYLLLIAIPLVALLAVPFFIAVRKENANGHNIASGVIHIVMAILIAFTAAGTTIVTTVTETNVYVVADVSYSADKNLDTVDEYIRNVNSALPRNSRMGVICFGKDYKLITRLGERFRTVKDAGVDNTETNIVEALTYAGNLFREGVIKRVVLITDAKQSYEGDSGALKRAVDGLVAKNIKVDAMFLDDNITQGEREVQLTDVEFSGTVYKGHRETATAVIKSSYEVNAIVELYQGSERIAEKSSLLTAGTNSVMFDELDTSESGSHDYEVRVRASDDTNSFNNNFYFTQNVTDSLDILIITDSSDDAQVIEDMYGDNAQIDTYIGRTELPASIEALCKYDEIILSNVDLRKVSNYTKFLESLDTCVSLFGKSLLTFGNVYIQDCENNELEVLDKILPVNYGNGNRDSKLYTILIDASRSMGFLSKLTRAKLAASKLVDLLNDNDKVCVVEFHGDVQRIQPLTDAVNRDRVKQTINSISVTQGTMLGVGLNEAYNVMKENAEYVQRQIMVISDGLAFDNGTSESGAAGSPQSIVESMYREGISTSVIDVGRGADNSTQANSAKRLLETLASLGKGTYHLADSEEKISDVIISEINNEANDNIVETPSPIHVDRRRDELVTDLIDKIESSSVNGYVNSVAKGSATAVISTTYRKPAGGTVRVPLYAYMKYGNGKTMTFTGSVSGNWIAPWKQGEETLFDSFFENVLDSAVPAEKTQTPYVTNIVKGNSYAVVEITPAPGAVHADSAASISVELPSGDTVQGDMVYDSSVYSYNFASRAVGKYTVTVTYSYSGVDYVNEFSFTVPYLSEYDSFAVFEASPLYKALGANGRVTEDGTIDLTNSEAETGLYTVDLTMPMLIICVVLFAVDIIIRKLKWEDIRSLFKKVNK